LEAKSGQEEVDDAWTHQGLLLTAKFRVFEVWAVSVLLTSYHEHPGPGFIYSQEIKSLRHGKTSYVSPNDKSILFDEII
jgi:hypothetical protein